MALKINIYPAELEIEYNQTLELLKTNNAIQRLWAHDHTLWMPDPTEISNRLDWLHLHETMHPEIGNLKAFAMEVHHQGFKTVVLLGMGGSSLAPEVFGNIFGNAPGFPRLIVLDTTDSVAIRKVEKQVELDTTIFIVGTKSGGTVETLSLFKYFYNLVSALQTSDPGKHFVAITDPGSKLEQIAVELNFRKTFLNNPNLGGRYSALSLFGLVPAALIGCNLEKLLESASQAAKENTPAAQLGALIATAAIAGQDKLTILSDDLLSPFSDWAEQLIAESTGKSGKGILPVVGEFPPKDLSNYSKDRVFVIQTIQKDKSLDVLSEQLKTLNFPLIETNIDNKFDLGELILTWEIATAIAGHLIGIHPFDQPDVESAKVSARESVQAFQENGKLPERETADLSSHAIREFLKNIQPGDYISLQAYLPPSPESELFLREMQAKLRDQYKVAVTLGFGPRFLHSTGQLHKGDRGNGLFIQFVSRAAEDINIPESAGHASSQISFDTLKQAQAIGDGNALKDNHRPLLVFNLDDPYLPKLEQLVEAL